MGNCVNSSNGKTKKGKSKNLPPELAPPVIPEVNKITGEEPNPNQNRESIPQSNAKDEKTQVFTEVEADNLSIKGEMSQKSQKESSREMPNSIEINNFEGEYIDLESEHPIIEYGKPEKITPFIIPLQDFIDNNISNSVKTNMNVFMKDVEKADSEAKEYIINGLRIFIYTFEIYYKEFIQKATDLDMEYWIAEGSNISQFRELLPKQFGAYEKWKPNPINEDELNIFSSYSYTLMEKAKQLQFDQERVENYEVNVDTSKRLEEFIEFLKGLRELIMFDINKAISLLFAGVEGPPNLNINLEDLNLREKAINNSEGYNNTHFSTILLEKENLIVTGWSAKVKKGFRLFFQTHSASNLNLIQQIDIEGKFQNQDSLRLAFHPLLNQLWVCQSSLPFIYKYGLSKDKKFTCKEKIKIPEEIGGLDSLFFASDFNLVFANSVKKGLIKFEETSKSFTAFGAKANTYLRVSKELLFIGCYKELLIYHFDLEQLVFREEIHDDYINSISFNSNPLTLLTGGWDNFIIKHSIELLENGGINLKKEEEFRPNGNTVFTMIPINSEEIIFTARDNYIYLYNFATGGKLKKKFPVNAAITSFVFDSKRVNILAKVGFTQIVMIN